MNRIDAPKTDMVRLLKSTASEPGALYRGQTWRHSRPDRVPPGVSRPTSCVDSGITDCCTATFTCTKTLSCRVDDADDADDARDLG